MNDSGIDSLLEQARGANWNDETLANKTIELAEKILVMGNAEMRRSEKKQAEQLARMMDDAPGKAFTLSLADRVFRPTNTGKSAEQFRHLVNSYGVPEYLSSFDKLQLRAGVKFSEYLPGIVMPMVTDQLRKESNKVILPSESNKLNPHLKQRKKAGIRMNLNQLGEAILGEGEAKHRLQQVIDRLNDPMCDYISVKISSVFSQIHLIGFEETVKALQERLRILYRTAMEQAVIMDDRTKRPKFVNLDMEEYRDLHLTCEAFKRTLMEEEFMRLEAGIVLQAYLPDSWEEQLKLIAWAKERVEKGGAKIKIRLVKGANLAMEKVEASLHDWEQAPYETKAMVDANFKRMLHCGLAKENIEYVRFGVASHNIFDLSYTLLLRELNDTKKDVDIEMLEGMANHQARVLADVSKNLLLYAPVVKKEDFHSAIAYLVRRLDENTSEENFLHDLFGMTPGSKAWENQKKRFLKACKEKDSTKYGPNRKQNRKTEEPRQVNQGDDFQNEKDTDWALRHNAEWIREKIGIEAANPPAPIPLIIDGQEYTSQLLGVGRDPSKNNEKSYEFNYADFDTIELALACAERSREEWASTTTAERGQLLHNVGREIGRIRGELIAAMVRDAGKVPFEGDVEVSEAIDFCHYYADGLDRDGMKDGISAKPMGTICVAPPWNFPCAIPCGGVAAALMAGNTVIFKPAPQAVYTAWVLVQAFWNAGISRKVLQFVPTPENEIGRKLITDPRISGMILTGAYDTGEMFKEWRPDLPLFAETSGKDAIIVTATADPDMAVKDLVKSAFGHAGQKCSAASLGIIEADVYDNPAFLRQLRDAAASLKVGPSWEPDTVIPPVIQEPEGKLQHALTQLEPGEEWLLKPEIVDGNPCLWSPGIKLGVKPGSWFHKNECFGPVLGLIRADNLDDAIAIQNDSDYGLTGGIQSLDEREIAKWKKEVQIGNAYINRPVTGAIVRRQPFGGWKKSSIGPGSKAGGPNYLTMFCSWTEAELPQQLKTPDERIAVLLEKLSKVLPDDAKRIRAAAGSQAKWWKDEFSVEHDPSQVHGESNIFRYIPEKVITLRAEENVSDADIAIMMMAAKLIGAEFRISLPSNRAWINDFTEHYCSITIESLDEFKVRLPQIARECRYLRYPGCSVETAREAEKTGMAVITRPAMANGRIEFLSCFKEQAVTETLHRYGNIIPSPEEVRGK